MSAPIAPSAVKPMIVDLRMILSWSAVAAHQVNARASAFQRRGRSYL